MGLLKNICDAVGEFNESVEVRVRQARNDKIAGGNLLEQWREIRQRVATVTTPTGLSVPRLALPSLDEPGEIARYLYGEGLPGEFPFVSSAYPQMYLGSVSEEAEPGAEEPTRLFAGLGLAEDTNRRFHYLQRHQRSMRLSTAFDGPTFYGLDSDAEGVFGKIGEGGVAIDTIDDMHRLYDGFPLGDQHFSVSMTINGPAPIILAMYVADARNTIRTRDHPETARHGSGGCAQGSAGAE